MHRDDATCLPVAAIGGEIPLMPWRCFANHPTTTLTPFLSPKNIMDQLFYKLIISAT
jgi:hypothetical protein